MATKKNAKKAAKALAPRFAAIIAGAAAIGYDVANSFTAGVALARSIGQGNKLALVEAGMEYRAGYVARSLADMGPAYAKRTGNMSVDQRIADARDIYAKAGPETDKPNRRTTIEHRACRAADQSWSTAKGRAFGKVAAKRKPRQAANANTTPVPVDLVKAAPKLPTKGAVNDYFVTAAAALLATVDKNAKLTLPALSSAVSDFKAAVAKALNL